MTQLSVNLNKFALLRNSRGINVPDLFEITKRCINFGAQGITLHPRPDERHTKFTDLPIISNIVNENTNVEFNIEGYPSTKFIKEIVKIKPHQVTLVPDPPEALTSSFGWDCEKNKSLLIDVVKKFQQNNIRVSLFVNPSIETLQNLNDILPERIELYTFNYAKEFNVNPNSAIKNYLKVFEFIQNNIPSISFNAGHDLNLNNLEFFLKSIPVIKEVSIGHAIICDAIEFGLQKTLEKYLAITKKY
tara:strand:- start:299 stop:1036 length:738 start_codon:yes stop_codon:yes gene_type:complete